MVLILSGPGVVAAAPGFSFPSSDFGFPLFRGVLLGCLVKRTIPFAEVGAS